MTAPNTITAAQLARLVGLPDCPVIVDVRSDEDHAADPRALPGAIRRNATASEAWATALIGPRVVIVCQHGRQRSEGAAAWLRLRGAAAETLEGGFEAWREGGRPLIVPEAIPPRDAAGRTVWVTRARPKVDRIACPWLIRRFVDPHAAFLFVAPAEVAAVADQFAATPFDIEGVFWSHRGARCTFDVMLEEFGLHLPALDHLALIVRGADTDAPDLAPQAAGLLAVSLGFSRMYKDDLAQLDAAMPVYDALYRWCRDAATETHGWPNARPA